MTIVIDADLFWYIAILLNASQGALIVAVFAIPWDKFINVLKTYMSCNSVQISRSDKATQTTSRDNADQLTHNNKPIYSQQHNTI